MKHQNFSESPPPVPSWTLELVWDGLKQRMKRQLLTLRELVVQARIKPSASPPDLRDCRRIVVFRTDRLGDAVLTFPLVQALKSAAPWAVLIYAVREPWTPLFHGQEGVDTVAALPASFQEQARVLSTLGPDLVIDPRADPAQESAKLSRYSGARWRIGFSGYGRERFFTSYRRPPRNTVHFCEEILDLLQFWVEHKGSPLRTPFLRAPKTAVPWWQGQRAARPVLSSFWVCIHPGGFYRTQRWPLESFLELRSKIRKELGVPVVWCGSQDVALPPAIFESDRETIYFGNLQVGQLAALLWQAGLYVGNNSGPLHLACALGTPTLSLMGPTFPSRWWPVGSHHRVLRLGVKCSPCNLGRCSHHTCLRGISVEQVFRAVREQIIIQRRV